jgi:Leucine-rich repeat (LRR) protein
MHFKNLDSLYINGTSLSEIDPNGLNSLNNLTWLDLAINHLEYFEPGMFEGLTNLQILTLCANRFARFQPGLFSNLRNLSILDLSNNPVGHDLHEDAFLGLEKLFELKLQRTPLAQVVNRQSPVIAKHLPSSTRIINNENH